jgi:UDP-N-acetylmuramate dehydrogenase
VSRTDWVREIEARLAGGAKRDEPLARYTAYRIGGPARLLATPKDQEQLGWLVKFCRTEGIELFVLGRGSNVLVSDAGFAGVVVRMESSAGDIVIEEDQVVAGAGVELHALVERTCARGLAGLERLAGIPGSVGGAAVMNAGAFGAEFFDHLVALEIMTPYGETRLLGPDDVPHGYRTGFDPRSGIVLSASLRLVAGDPRELQAEISELLRKRWEKQPLEYPSCGSVFKRPPGDYAGRLIEACGLKGLQKGRAKVSEKHANFIINLGGATAEDVLWLMREIRRRVSEKFGILLEPEVRLVGFDRPVEELLAV